MLPENPQLTVVGRVLAMDAKQKVEHYYWDSLPRESVRPGVTRAAFRGDQVLMVMNWLQPGMQTNPHQHPYEQLTYIVSGTMRLVVGDRVIECGAGSVTRIPPNVVHYGEPSGSEAVLNLDVFSPIREDYRHLVEYQRVEEQG
jgi:quercetin dioxygenase-like cupin family protein